MEPLAHDADGLPHAFKFSPLRRLALAPDEGSPAWENWEIGLDDGDSMTVSDVWGEMSAGDVLARKRTKRGITDVDTLKEYMRDRARRHTIKSTVSTKEAMQQLVDNKLTFLVVVSADWSPPARPQVRRCRTHPATISCAIT